MAQGADPGIVVMSGEGCSQCARGLQDPENAARVLRVGALERRREGEAGGDDQGTEEWLEKRRGVLTASGMSGYTAGGGTRARTRALADKCGLTTFTGNEATQHGSMHEAEAVAHYEAATGHRVAHFGLLMHPDCPEQGGRLDAEVPRIGGSPDGMTYCGRCVEVKCPWKRIIVPGSVPRNYAGQVQVLMQVMGVDVCDFVQYVPEWMARERGQLNMQLDVTEVSRDDGWWEKQRPVLGEFWRDLVEALGSERVREQISRDIAPRHGRRRETYEEFLANRHCMFVQMPGARVGTFRASHILRDTPDGWI